MGGAGKILLRAGLADAGPGDPEVQVGVDCPRDERIQFGVVESLPPFADLLSLAGGAAAERLAPLGRHVDHRPLVVGSNGAARDQDRQRDGDQDLRSHRSFSERQ